MTHPLAEDAAPMTLTALTAPDGAVIVTLAGDLDIASAPAAREWLLSLVRPGGRLALPGTSPAVMAAQALPAQAQAEPGADSGELHSAVAPARPRSAMG